MAKPCPNTRKVSHPSGIYLIFFFLGIRRENHMDWQFSPAAFDPHMSVLDMLALITAVSALATPNMVIELADLPPIPPSIPSVENLVSSIFTIRLFCSSKKVIPPCP
jgi:hypothetical protein